MFNKLIGDKDDFCLAVRDHFMNSEQGSFCLKIDALFKLNNNVKTKRNNNINSRYNYIML